MLCVLWGQIERERLRLRLGIKIKWWMGRDWEVVLDWWEGGNDGFD